MMGDFLTFVGGLGGLLGLWVIGIFLGVMFQRFLAAPKGTSRGGRAWAH